MAILKRIKYRLTIWLTELERISGRRIASFLERIALKKSDDLNINDNPIGYGFYLINWITDKIIYFSHQISDRSYIFNSQFIEKISLKILKNNKLIFYL